MSQHDYALANASGASFRADANDALAAAVSLNSGSSAPATTFAYMLWADTTSGWLKQRDAANSAWIPRAPLGTGAAVDIASASTLDLTANAASSATLRVTGTTATTAITLADGQTRLLRAAAAWPITHGASLICPGSASYTCAAGDLVLAIGEATGVVRLVIWKADGTAVAGTSTQEVLQIVEATPVTSNTSIATATTYDDSIPQNTEGTEVITVSITPSNASNRLRIEFDASHIGTSSSAAVVFALFQDSTANALSVASAYPASTSGVIGRLSHEMAAGTTSATTFKIRISIQSGAAYLNGNGSGTRVFGGISSARLRVTEIAP